MRKRMSLIVGASAALACAAALPSYAGTSSGTTVSLAVNGAGTRQLDVLDLAGSPLTNLGLQPGTPAPFRVRVTDTNISDLTAPQSGFSVGAVLNNLYLKNSSGYDWTSSIPAKNVTIGYATNPLNAFGVSFDDLPDVSVSGTIPNCSTLQLDGILSATDLTGIASPLCSLLGLSGSGLTVAPFDVVSSLTTTITPTVSNLLDLPFQISGNQSGNFQNADYANGIGLNDPNPNVTGTTTSRQIMQGVPGMTATLQSEITAALGTVPTTLTSATGTGSLTALSDLMAALTSSSDSTLSQLGTDLGSLTSSQQVQILNNLVGSLVDPALADLSNVVGTYNAFPMLTADAGTAASGTYEGTMTVTLVQQ